MATVVDTDFEGTYPPSGWSEAGTTANIGTSTLQAYLDGVSMRVNNGTAVNAWIANATRTERTLAGRFYLYIATAVSGVASIVQFTNASGNLFIRLTTANVLRVTMNTTNFDGPTLSTGRWYRINFLAQSSAGTATLDVTADGGTAINGTRVQAAADMTAHNIGQVTAVTCDLYFDHFKMTDQSSEHPLPPIYKPFYRHPLTSILAQ